MRPVRTAFPPLFLTLALFGLLACAASGTLRAADAPPTPPAPPTPLETAPTKPTAPATPAAPAVPAAPGVDATPEDVTRLYMEANRKSDFAACAALMHSRALTQLKTLLLPVIDAARQSGDRSLLKLFDQVEDYKTLVELTPKDFYIKFMQGVTKLNPSLKNALANTQIETIGHVLEKETTAHVVCRMKSDVDGVSVVKMEVISLEKDNGAWRALLTGNIEGMAAMLQRRFKAGARK